MTINDIKAQTKQINEYASKLQKIKNKVSSELFDEIASFDMKEGSAYIDRLLAMSAKDLSEYNKAYTEKMKAAEKAGENIYNSDIKKVSVAYQNEINKAFKDLPKQLEELGAQTMKGFVLGLTNDTDYMSKEIKIYINSMLDTFKKQLNIHSPSKVMEIIGDYTGEGFVIGLKNTINNVRAVASELAKSAAVPLEDLQSDINLSKSAVNAPGQNGAVGIGGSTVVNNYNLTQNNTSPKPLSALDTFRARRQQVELVKAIT
jgi:virulence-associated protein VapD